MPLLLLLILLLTACTPSSPTPASQPASRPARPNNPSTWPAFSSGGLLHAQAPDLGPPPYELAWTFQTTPATPRDKIPEFFGGAAVVDQTVYIADRDATLYALDLATGKPRWSHRFPKGQAIDTTPLVAHGIVCIGDHNGVMHALDAATGEPLWQTDTEAAIHCSPNLAAINDAPVLLFGNDTQRIFCLDLATGRELWTVDTHDRIYATPAVAGSTAYIACCDGRLRAIDIPTGKVLFTYPFLDATACASTLLPDRLVFSAVQGHAFAIARDGSHALWTFDLPEPSQHFFYASAALTNDSPPLALFGCRDSCLYALDTATGKLRWTLRTRGDIDSTPVVAGPRAYVASKDHSLYVLNASTGQLLWQYRTPSPISAPLTIANAHLLIPTESGTLLCLH